ncbi:hypothetical protein N658DRAFT_333660 [Parathielavia hyrcaniae]|uniref:Uncharacterized protein n=1 Tax=Parathielavia hyrcaniae TaxID=113614 RepID=A0AAN6PS64_9PEZI|nr:hypothetical protein N658DRAFT_333660 [Parathielavia hyrcaniae]
MSSAQSWGTTRGRRPCCFRPGKHVLGEYVPDQGGPPLYRHGLKTSTTLPYRRRRRSGRHGGLARRLCCQNIRWKGSGCDGMTLADADYAVDAWARQQARAHVLQCRNHTLLDRGLSSCPWRTLMLRSRASRRWTSSVSAATDVGPTIGSPSQMWGAWGAGPGQTGAARKLA